MTPLRRALLSLKTPNTKPWHLVVSPDPHCFLGRQRGALGQDESEYLMRIDATFDRTAYSKRNMSFAVAATSDKLPASKSLALKEPGVQTSWIRVIDSNRKTADGRSVRDVMKELLSEFPKFDLQTSQGTEAAIKAIEGRLGGIATFEDETLTH